MQNTCPRRHWHFEARVLVAAICLIASIADAASSFRCDSSKKLGPCGATIQDKDGRPFLKANTRQCSLVTYRNKGIFGYQTVVDEGEEIPTTSAKAADFVVESCDLVHDNNQPAAADAKDRLNSLLADADENVERARQQAAASIASERLSLQASTATAASTLANLPPAVEILKPLMASAAALSRSSVSSSAQASSSGTCSENGQKAIQLAGTCQTKIDSAQGICLTGRALLECGGQLESIAGSCTDLVAQARDLQEQGRAAMQACQR